MGCSVWAIDFFAFMGDGEASIAGLSSESIRRNLGITFLIFFLLMIMIFYSATPRVRMCDEPAFYRFAHRPSALNRVTQRGRRFF